MLVLSVQKYDSVKYIHISILFQTLFPYRLLQHLSIVCCAILLYELIPVFKHLDIPPITPILKTVLAKLSSSRAPA